MVTVNDLVEHGRWFHMAMEGTGFSVISGLTIFGLFLLVAYIIIECSARIHKMGVLFVGLISLFMVSVCVFAVYSLFYVVPLLYYSGTSRENAAKQIISSSFPASLFLDVNYECLKDECSPTSTGYKLIGATRKKKYYSLYFKGNDTKDHDNIIIVDSDRLMVTLINKPSLAANQKSLDFLNADVPEKPPELPHLHADHIDDKAPQEGVSVNKARIDFYANSDSGTLTLFSSGSITNVEPESHIMRAILDDEDIIPDANAIRLETDNASVPVWCVNNTLYIHSNMRLVSPAYKEVMGNQDSYVYRVESTTPITELNMLKADNSLLTVKVKRPG